MFVTYTPEDGEKQTWEFVPGRVRVSEQVLVEKRADMRWAQWVEEIKIGLSSARRVLLWHLIRREHPGLRWEDTPDYCADELLVELSVQELSEWRDTVLKLAGSEEDREQMLAVIDGQIAESSAKHGDGATGKAPSKTSSSATRSPSVKSSASAPGSSESS